MWSTREETHLVGQYSEERDTSQQRKLLEKTAPWTNLLDTNSVYEIEQTTNLLT